MKCFLIRKGPAPRRGSYRDWKPLLAREGQNQCVYCAIPEGRFGGFRNFHVEHFRPKSAFPEQENNYANLFYSCAICNTFKGDEWIGEPTSTTIPCYPDPSATDYSELFGHEKNGELRGTCTAGTYIVERLFLNRPQLITERRLAAFSTRATTEMRLVTLTLQELASAGSPDELRAGLQLADAVARLTAWILQLREVVPYAPQDVARR